MRTAPIDIEFFKARRQRLAQLIPDSVLILPSWPAYYRNADTEHAYRPESNLYYLTGFEEPDSCLVFRPGKTPETVLFVRQKNVERETWDGFRFGLQGARDVFGVDQTYAIEDFEKLAPDLLRGCGRVFYTMFRNREFDERFGRAMMGISGWRPRFGLGLPPIEDASAVVGELRILKTQEEVEAMRRAAQISAEAHIEVMKATRPGVTERALHGLFIKEVMDRGASSESYGGIFATGKNATTLHYRFNDATLEDGQLLLVDAGAEYQYYAGDITRTFPVNGKFSSAQKRIYGKILQVQKDVIRMLKPGLPHLDLQKYTVQKLTEILIEENVLKGTVEENVSASRQTRYYPHGVSHLLGLDVHDAGVLQVAGRSRPLESGMAITIEPGLYFPHDDLNVPAELRGIGIRIEDDIVITAEGCEVLTKGVTKEIEEMEALIGVSSRGK